MRWLLSGAGPRQLLLPPGLGTALPLLVSCQLPVADHAQTFVPYPTLTFRTRKLPLPELTQSPATEEPDLYNDEPARKSPQLS